MLIPDVANILQVSREALYRICTVFVELAMMLQLTPTTYQWAVADTSEKVQVPSAAATAEIENFFFFGGIKSLLFFIEEFSGKNKPTLPLFANKDI